MKLGKKYGDRVTGIIEVGYMIKLEAVLLWLKK
jgi:hypothetical protein